MGLFTGLQGMLGMQRAGRHERREPILAAPSARKSVGGSTSAMPGLFYGMGILPGSTGVAVTPYTALQAATVYACAKRLSEDIGKLPIRIMRRLPRGGARVDHDHLLNRLLRRPNRWQTPSQCWRYYVWSLALRGNGYAPILRGPAGEPQEIIPMNPDRIGVMQAESGDVFYQVNHPAFRPGLRLDRDNVLHAYGMSFDGITGVSPIAVAQDAIGLGLATQQHGATLFRQGAQVSGVIKHPGTLTPEGKNYLSQAFKADYAGVQNAHGTPVLDEGMSFEKISQTNEDAQFLGTRGVQVIEICRYFGVPPHKVFDLSNAHFNNLEQSEQQYINDTLLPIAGQIEEVCERNLLFDDERGEWMIRFDFDALLRADRKTRYDTNAVGINNKFLTPNEARIDDNREPNVPGGDEYLQALNMRDTGAAPPAPAPAAGDA